MAYQMLFTDLDGTLLNDAKILTEANKQAARGALAAGKRIVVNSGRSWESLERLEKELGIYKPGNYGAAFNGGLVYEFPADAGAAHKVLLKNELPNALGLEIAARLKSLGGDILVYTQNHLYAERETEYNAQYKRTSQIPIRVVDDVGEIKDDIMKILALGEYSELQKLSRLASEFSDRAYIVFSCPVLLEFGAPAAHKGSAVKFLADRLHIPLDEIIAMGDESNDITMLKTAGLGIAVANAVDETKKAAKIISPYSNNEDAFAKVIEEYLLS